MLLKHRCRTSVAPLPLPGLQKDQPSLKRDRSKRWVVLLAGYVAARFSDASCLETFRQAMGKPLLAANFTTRCTLPALRGKPTKSDEEHAMRPRMISIFALEARTQFEKTLWLCLCHCNYVFVWSSVLCHHVCSLLLRSWTWVFFIITCMNEFSGKRKCFY